MKKAMVHIEGPIDEETGIPIWEFWAYEEA